LTETFFIFRYTLSGKFIYSVQEQITTLDQAVRFANLNLSFADSVDYFKAEKVNILD